MTTSADRETGPHAVGAAAMGAMAMMLRGAAFALLLLVLLGAAGAQAVVHVPNNDPEMVQAQAKARATLAEFWRAFERPGATEEGFALKVHATGLQRGQRIEIDER